MSSNRSWSWLAPRLSIRAMLGTRKQDQPARPCLPRIEPLDDRVLLSLVLVPGDTSPDQILIGLLRGSIGQPDGQSSLIQNQLAALKIAASMPVHDPNVEGVKLIEANKLTNSFMKINTLLSSVALGDIKGESGDAKHKEHIEFINAEFSKLDSLIRGLGEGEHNLLLPAVQQVEDSTYKLYAELTSLGSLGKLDSKVVATYSKIASDFTDVNNGLLKLGEDVLFRKAGKGQQEYLQIKMETVLVSDYKYIDEGLKAQLQEFAGFALETMNSLLQPPPVFEREATGPFSGGVSIAGEIVDDIVT